MPNKHINTRLFSLIMCAFLTFPLWDHLCFSGQASDLVDRSQNSYLKGHNINTEHLSFDNVQSYCFICWGEGEDDPWTGLQNHHIVYVNDPSFKVRSRLASIRKDNAIIFHIKFYKFAHEQIVNKTIKLPDERVSFYSHLISQGNEGPQKNKLNVLSGSIDLKTLGGNNNKTVGHFTIHLSNNAVIEGGFSVTPRTKEYGP